MYKTNEYTVTFEENGGEYTGWLSVMCKGEVKLDSDNPCVFFVDGIRIQIDERIISIEKVEDDEIIGE